MKKNILLLPLVALLLSSCATAGLSHYRGVGRIKQYELSSSTLPPSFDGLRIAFASDFHYESKFTRQRLSHAVEALKDIQPDLLVLGGDYIGRKEASMDTLFQALAQIKSRYGTFAVLGNHDYAYGYKMVTEALEAAHITTMEHTVTPIIQNKDTIYISGVRNPFDLKRNGQSPCSTLSADKFILLVSHTPDYAEDADVSNVALVMAGHTHGGQISLFKSWSPSRFSKYGKRFMTGLKKNHNGVPVIITNGLGTSRRNVRFCTPSEIVVITFHRKK